MGQTCMSKTRAAGIPIMDPTIDDLEPTLFLGLLQARYQGHGFLHKHTILFLGLFRFRDHAGDKHRVGHHFGSGMVGRRHGLQLGGAMLGPAKNAPMASMPEGLLGFSLSAACLAAQRFSSLGADTHRSTAG